MIELIWSNFKSIVNSKGLYIQYYEYNDTYWLYLADGPLVFTCNLYKSAEDTTDLTDFETNYKTTKTNKDVIPPITSNSFTAKTLISNGVVKKLFARNTGMQFAVSAGTNTLTYTATYPWVKILGVECIGAETLDTVDMKVYDNASGTYSGVPNYLLNQFAYSVNVGKDYYIRTSQFDADLYTGMIIQFTYNSVSAKTIGFNLIMNEVKS